ncbi:MAG: hypothetical protein EDM05_61645 [Leptolyngbya sp. IPPAS B-1204]|nr:MAG: hypothetical protein EDM05_19080 [Leptolyngbya sp. IPPAS B-1204]
MSYYSRLHPWCVIRCLPESQTLIIARFRKRSDAEERLKAMQKLIADGVFELVFDVEVQESEAEEKQIQTQKSIQPSF